MVIKKGEKLRLGIPNPNAGRKPSKKTLIKRWERDNPGAYAQLMQSLYEAGIGEIETKCPHCNNVITIPSLGDKDSAMYVVDRLKGKPKQFTESTIKGQLIISPDDMAIQAEIQSAERDLITENAPKLLE